MNYSSSKRLYALMMIFCMCFFYVPLFSSEAYTVNNDEWLETAYNPIYIINHINEDYVKADEIEMSAFFNVVTAAKGVATYNIKKQSDFEVTQSNYLAGMSYQIPVYDIDKKSNYYVAIPNVNLGDPNFKAYDLMLTYNDDYGECIEGYHYSDGILYIPKSAIDKPKNDYYVPDGSMIAIQLNYAIGGDMDFSKTIPVQICNYDSKPKCEILHCANLFDLDSMIIDTGLKNQDANKISVFLNGQLIPIYDKAWEYNPDTGTIKISVMPGVISNVNIMMGEKKNPAEKIRDGAENIIKKVASACAVQVNADTKVTLLDMKYYKIGDTTVKLNIPNNKFFQGWRGYYTAKHIHGNSDENQSKIHSAKGWKNSIKYMYGGYTTMTGDGGSYSDAKYDYRMTTIWAISSYATGVDLGLYTEAGTIGVTEKVKHAIDADGNTKSQTIWEWLYERRNQLELNNQELTGGKANGLGGTSNFAIQFPSKVTGCEKNLISDTNNSNYGRENDTLSFNSNQIDNTYYYAASCNHLESSTGTDSESNSAVYVTCLGKSSTENFVVLAFVMCKPTYSQDACAIYKFKTDAAEVTRKTSFKLCKTTDDGGKVSGFQFNITGPSYPDGKVVTTDENGEWSTTTDDNGKALVAGSYTVTEIMNDEQKVRYKEPESQTFELSNDNNASISFSFENKAIKKKFLLIKTSNDGKVAGINFRLTGETSWGDKIEYTGTTSGDGQLIFDGERMLPPGRYVIEETDFDNENYINTHVLSGYTNPAIAFEISGKEDSETIELEFDNLHVPELSTHAASLKTDDNICMADREAIIKDTLSYRYMIPGEKYRIDARLIDKDTGEELRDASGDTITTSVEFKPDKASGNLDIRFREIDATMLAGRSAVVFEKIYKSGENIANHEEIGNENQTVHIPKISTVLLPLSSDSHYCSADALIRLRDTIHYENLLVGRKYAISGKLYDKRTGIAIVGNDGKFISANTYFVPTNSSGDAEVVFQFPGKKFAGKTLVAFEKLTLDEKIVAAHTDLNDANQTIHISENSKEKITEVEYYDFPKTGENSLLFLYIVLFSVTVLLTIIIYKIK